MRLVLDWDGTVTDRDTLELLIERFGDIATYRRTGALMGHSLSHDDALVRSIATARPDGSYMGDGYSDRCAALAATRVFATGSLALYLQESAIAYKPFDDWYDVARRLSPEAYSA